MRPGQGVRMGRDAQSRKSEPEPGQQHSRGGWSPRGWGEPSCGRWNGWEAAYPQGADGRTRYATGVGVSFLTFREGSANAERKKTRMNFLSSIGITPIM